MEYGPDTVFRLHIAVVEILLAVLSIPIVIELIQLATRVLTALPICKSIALFPLLLPPVVALSATAKVNAPVPFGTIATSTFAAALVAFIDTTGTVAFGAEVFTHSVKLVSHPPPVLAIVTIPSTLVQLVVRVIQVPSTSFTEPHAADRVAV